MARSVMVIDYARKPIWCPFEVNPSRIGKDAEVERARLARIKGLRFDQCGRPAEIAIDGHGFCRRHAGEVLLREALES